MNKLYKLKCVVLEDEDDNRNWLLKKLANFPELDLVGEAATLDESYALIAQAKPDAAFMDIQLIGGDVFTLLSRLKDNGLPLPYIVMTTGYPDYVMTALNEYRRYIVQYLVKPFVEDWQMKLRKSVDALMAAKMNDMITLQENSPVKEKNQDHIFINNKGNYLRLDFDKIAYFEAAGGGETYIVTDAGTHQADITLNKFLEMLPADQFLRISKTNIANIKRIMKINREDRTVEVECNNKTKSLGVGDNFYAELVRKIPTSKDGLAKSKAGSEKSGNSFIVEREVANRIQDVKDENTGLMIEKNKSEALLDNMLPKEISSELKQSGQVNATKFDLVSVLFIDIKDFTKHSENLPPENLINEIDFLFSLFDKVADKYRIEKIKTIGDAYMCAGGVPEADTDNPARVVAAALEMRKEVALYQQDRKANNQPFFEVRMGIHSGPVIAGIVGNRKFSYDIWGDTVNIASRIESIGQVGFVNISEATFQYIKKDYPCKYVGAIEAKNKGELDVYVIDIQV